MTAAVVPAKPLVDDVIGLQQAHGQVELAVDVGQGDDTLDAADGRGGFGDCLRPDFDGIGIAAARRYSQRPSPRLERLADHFAVADPLRLHLQGAVAQVRAVLNRGRRDRFGLGRFLAALLRERRAAHRERSEQASRQQTCESVHRRRIPLRVTMHRRAGIRPSLARCAGLSVAERGAARGRILDDPTPVLQRAAKPTQAYGDCQSRPRTSPGEPFRPFADYLSDE
ncbi:hypothetical protein [Lysobacter capsici]|uniref:hypothetical protein n=1 Tax=Lysobacter capsici TaxID=435897 RepID=UPI000ABB57C5|nr:hypothetical protein [Lysobacter capsici]